MKFKPGDYMRHPSNPMNIAYKVTAIHKDGEEYELLYCSEGNLRYAYLSKTYIDEQSCYVLLSPIEKLLYAKF